MDIQSSREDSEANSVDWRGKPCMPNKHGGMRAAFFVLGLSFSQVIEHELEIEKVFSYGLL